MDGGEGLGPGAGARAVGVQAPVAGGPPRLLGAAFEGVHEAAFLLDDRGRILDVNAEACQRLGRPRERLTTMQAWDVDPAFSAAAWPAHWAALREQGSLRFETRHVTADGRELRVEVTASYVEQDGVGYNLALARDIAERLEDLRHFASLDRINRVIQAETDLDTVLRDVLDEVLAIFACDRAFLLYPCDPDSPTWTVPIERTTPEHPGVRELGIAMPMDDHVAATLGALLARPGPIAFGPGGEEPLPASAAERFGFRSVLSMALRPRVGQAWQFGLHQCDHAREWTAADRRLLAAIGARLEDGLTALLARRDLAASEERYRHLFENSPVAIWELDLSGVRPMVADLRERGVTDLAAYLRANPDAHRALLAAGRLVDVNAAAIRLFGATDREEYRRHMVELMTPELVAGVAGALAAMAGGRWSVRQDATIHTLHGEPRIVTVEYAVPPGYEATFGRVILSGIDITERKRVEQEHARLAAAVEQAEESILITDTAGLIRYVNPALERTSGFARDELLGQSPRMLGIGEGDQAFYRAMWDELLDGRPWHGTLTNRRRNGEAYETDATVTPLRDAAGELVAFVGVTRDVSRERALEAQLRQANKMEAIGRLAGGIAHDFNNLITVIRGYGELLALGLPDESPLRRDLDQVVLASDRASQLTRQLLAFSRRLPLTPEVVAPDRVVAELAPMLQRLLGEHIDLQVRAAGGATVYVDRSQLDQVILNLAVNARDAMPDGGRLSIGVATVTLSEAEAEGHEDLTAGAYVAITVADTGTGMSPETCARVFEPFFTTKELGKGTGMGLATVYGIVTASHGAIEVHSEVGRGTTFRMLLPVSDRLPDGTRAAVPELPRGTERILLVEDDESVRAFARRALEGLGYEVAEAPNGRVALEWEAANAGPVDLLLTDAVMPGIRGTALAEALRARRPGLRVLLVSGFAEEALGEARPAGMAFLPKPYTRSALARAVRGALDG